MKRCDRSAVFLPGKRLRREVAFVGITLLVSIMTACQPKSVTMDLEGMTLNAGGQAMIQAMENYQTSTMASYSYPALGPWMDINRTACIQGTDDGEVVVFTMGEELEWRVVQYAYPFYEDRSLAEGSEAGEAPLVIAPLIVSPDGLAVAYQSLHSQGRFLEIAEVDKPTVLIGSDGQVYSTDSEMEAIEEVSWNLVKGDWTSDGRYLLFYRTNDWNIGVDNAGTDLEFDLEEEKEDENSQSAKGVVLTIKDIYGYDRQTCQVRKVWQSMRLNLPVSKVPNYEVVVDVGENGAAMFLLFDEKADCPDVKIWNQNGVMEFETVKLPENPCIQMDTNQGIYYYQEAGDIWKATLSKNGQPQRILSAGSQLQAFLISEDARRIFTIETREEIEDVCLYLQDEKGSWYRQVIAVGTQGACSLQLSDDQQRLLVECRSEDENRAVVIYFGKS